METTPSMHNTAQISLAKKAKHLLTKVDIQHDGVGSLYEDPFPRRQRLVDQRYRVDHEGPEPLGEPAGGGGGGA